MRREEFFDQVTSIYDLVNFCSDNYAYESFVSDYDIMDAESRDSYIDEDVYERLRYNNWTDVRDYLDSLESSSEYDYWRLCDGEWYGIDDCEFDYLRDQLVELLDENDFFDEEGEEDDGNPSLNHDPAMNIHCYGDLPVASEELEPGDFTAALGSFSGVPQFDTVVARNLARLRAEADERIRVDEELQRIMEENNRLTAGNLSAVFQ